MMIQLKGNISACCRIIKLSTANYQYTSNETENVDKSIGHMLKGIICPTPEIDHFFN